MASFLYALAGSFSPLVSVFRGKLYKLRKVGLGHLRNLCFAYGNRLTLNSTPSEEKAGEEACNA